MTLANRLITVAQAKTGRLKYIAGDPIGAGSLSGVIEVQSGWVLVNGVVLPNSGKTAALFTVVGTRFGTAGQLPVILDGVVPIPKGATSFPTVGVAGGEVNHILSLAEYPSHVHGDVDNIGPSHGNSLDGYLNIDGWSNESQANGGVTKTSNNYGGGGSHSNMPLFQVGGYVLVKL